MRLVFCNLFAISTMMQHNWKILNLPDPWPIIQCTKCMLAVDIKENDLNILDRFTNCPGEPAKPTRQEPDLTPEIERLGITLKMAKRWVAALLKWRAAGYPTRTQSEVDQIAAICETNECGAYTKGRCSKCGCCVSHSKIPVINKAKLATESCPVDKW